MNRSRGVVSTMVIAMFVLISVTFVSLSVWFATQARRTQATLAGAQIRQLLMAAVPAALEQVKASGPEDRELTLPTPIADAHVLLTITKSPQGAKVHILAELRGKKGAQDIDLEQANGQWQVTNTRLLVTP